MDKTVYAAFTARFSVIGSCSCGRGLVTRRRDTMHAEYMYINMISHQGITDTEDHNNGQPQKKYIKINYAFWCLLLEQAPYFFQGNAECPLRTTDSDNLEGKDLYP